MALASVPIAEATVPAIDTGTLKPKTGEGNRARRTTDRQRQIQAPQRSSSAEMGGKTPNRI